MESNIHILLIEDNPADVRLIREYLSFAPPGQSFQISQSSTLKGGYEILEKENIDIVLLDLHLPDSLGLKSFDRLIETFSNLPIVVLTGFSDTDTGLLAVRRGAQDFLSKDDLNPESLLRCINYGIERNQMLTRLEQAQSLANMGNWEYDPQKEEVYCSKSALKILGLKAKSNGLEACFQCLLPEDKSKLLATIGSALLNKEDFKVDAQTQSIPPGKRFLEIQGKAAYSHKGKNCSVVGTVQDVTDRMEKQELIREKELAIKSSKLKEEFLANTSHEIRTPLNAILHLTRILSESDPTAEQKGYLNLIKNAGSTLLAVVNDVLDLSKIEAGKMDFSQSIFDLNILLDSVIGIMGLKASEEQISLHKSIDEKLHPYLVGDQVRLNQILINLINNGIKYTEDGHVSIHAREIERKGKQVVVEFMVEDTGIGIPANKLDFIFLGFKRLDTDLNRKYSGTGLGLTIVEQLVKLQGGEIRVISEEGKGSRFIFSLPFELAEAPSKQASSESENSYLELVNSEVLLVEDNLLNQIVTEHLLRNWGIKVDIAQNGKIAIEMLLQKSYDLVLMDLQMPVMDGYDATRYIRKEFTGSLSEIPIIALTANAFHGMDDECMNIGMNDYISKPFEKSVLFEKMKACLKKDDLPKAAIERNRHEEIKPDNTEMTYQLIDLTYLKNVSGDDSFLFKMAIKKYLEVTPETLDLIDSYFAQGNHEELGRSVHKLKSSVATMGIVKAKEIILQIEHILRNKLEKMPLSSLVQELNSVVKKSFAELRQVLANEAA